MKAHRLALLSCCLLALAAVTAGTAAAVPPPTPFCSACGDAFEADVAEEYPELTVGESTATIDVHENGSATWIVRNRLGDAATAESLVDDPLLTDVGRFGGLGGAELTESSVEAERTLVLRFADPSFAESAGGGTLRSGAFTSEYGYRNLDGLGADRLTVDAPEGTRVDWTVPGATVSDDGERTTLTELDRGGFLTVVPRDRAVAPLASVTAVGQLVLPSLLTNALWQALLPAVVVGLLAVVAWTALARTAREFPWDRRHAVAGIAGLGGLVLVGGLAIVVGTVVESGGWGSLGGGSGEATVGGGPAAIGVGLGLLAFGVRLRRLPDRESLGYRSLATIGGGAVLLAVGSALAVAVAFERPDSLRTYPWRTLVVVPLLGFVLAGFALGGGRSGLAAATVALGLIVAVLPAVPVGSVSFGGIVLSGYGLTWTALLAAVGTPFALLGVSLSRETAGSAGDTENRDARPAGTGQA